VVAEIIKTDIVRLNVGIPESDVNAIKTIEDFKLTIDALGGKTFDAKKYFLSRTTGNLARLYNLELSIDNKQGEILPDMFARVDIVKQTFDSALIVPLYSLITLNDQNIVYVEDNGVARQKTVSTGIQEGWMIQFTEGLARNDKVIIVGHRSVSDGQEINVIKQIRDIKEL
jgi:RND family efflux transporter MFP subunit